jgi:hypothetical protein
LLAGFTGALCQLSILHGFLRIGAGTCIRADLLPQRRKLRECR